MKRAFLFTILVLLALPLFAALPQFTGSAQPDHWDFTSFAVVWDLNPSTGTNVTGSAPASQVIQNSFGTWLSAPNAALSVSRGPDSTDTAGGFNQSASNNTNLVCFVCSGDFSKDSSTLAVTTTTTADAAGQSDGHGGRTRFVGQILDADILFNPSTQFSTGGGSGQDLQTVATHEIGHFFGLDHTGVVSAMMFPFAPAVQTTLAWDDVAGIALLYPKSAPDVATGTISGSVMHEGGAGVFGAHVFADPMGADDPFSGRNIRRSPVSTLSLPDGSYQITGVPPGSYMVTAEPLDLPVTNSDVQGYAGTFGKSAVETNFTTRWH